MITRNSISERFGIILWFSIPADLCSKVYVWWTKHKLHFLIFLKTVCLANGLHHLFCSTAVHHDISHRYEYVLIIEFIRREPIIGHSSKLRWINIHSHPHISTISTCSETKVYNQFYEIWCPWRLSNLQKIHIPDNNYYSSLVNEKILSWSEPHPLLWFFIQVWILDVCALHIKAIKGWRNYHYMKTIPWQHWCIHQWRWCINLISVNGKPGLAHEPRIHIDTRDHVWRNILISPRGGFYLLLNIKYNAVIGYLLIHIILT